jgi:hypothetical protein
MTMEIVPKLELKDVSALDLGTFVYTASGPAFVCRNVADATSRLLAIYNEAERRFEHNVPSPGEKALAVSGEYVLEPDIDSLRPDAPLDRTSTTQLFIAAEALWLAVYIAQPTRQLRALNMTTWIAGATPSTFSPSAHKWKFGVRLADGKPHWLLKVDATPRQNTTLTPQTA